MWNSCIPFNIAILFAIQIASPVYAVDTNQADLAPGVMTSYEATTYDGMACLQIAEKCLKQVGYSEGNGMDIDDGKFIIWGDNGSNTAVIRCIPDHKLVFFIGAGPNHSANDNAVDALSMCY